MIFRSILFSFCISILFISNIAAQKKSSHKNFAVIGYYAGRGALLDSFPIEKLTHIIFSFTHLNGNKMFVSNAGDTATIQKMVALKSRNPELKVILSIGGWGGCKSCSDVFASDTGRKEFAVSVKGLLDYFQADGIDLDWEYPAISGYPGHRFVPGDKQNFTALIIALRDELGKKKEISFAAGGFTQFIDQSIEWKKVMPKINRVNLMTYDLVGGYATQTGHHTPLYSTPQQKESTDNAVRSLLAMGMPANKLVIGAAFYARIFENEANSADGLNQKSKFKSGVSFNRFPAMLSKDSGYVYHWDATAQAPYLYLPSKKWFVTFDDSSSIRLKTEYALKKRLNGIMFWQLADDSFRNGLLDVIDETKKKY